MNWTNKCCNLGSEGMTDTTWTAKDAMKIDVWVRRNGTVPAKENATKQFFRNAGPDSGTSLRHKPILKAPSMVFLLAAFKNRVKIKNDFQN